MPSPIPPRDIDCGEADVESLYNLAVFSATRAVFGEALLGRIGFRYDRASGREGKARHLARMARVGRVAATYARATHAAMRRLSDAGLDALAVGFLERFRGLMAAARVEALESELARAEEIDRVRRPGMAARMRAHPFPEPGRN